MKNIGDWLYIIIIIIAAASSLISSMRKKQQTILPQKPQAKPTPNVQERKITQEEYRKQTTKSKKTYQSIKKTIEPITNIYPSDEGKSAITEEEAAFIMPIQQEEKAAFTMDDIPQNTQEWQKAFIYNEIFKRKY